MKDLSKLAVNILPSISTKAKKTIHTAFADYFAVAMAALDEPIYQKIIKYLEKTAKGSIPLLGTSIKVSTQQAALAWGTLGHALDYDDISAVLIGHPSVVLIPALTAVASEYGKSGKELFEAYYAGYEAIGRISAGAADSQYQRGWHTTATIGIFGAVIGVARLLGLNSKQTEHALGIACSMASGIRANFGTMTKPFHAGWAAGNAVFAVELAINGFDSSPDALDSSQSYFNLFGGSYQVSQSDRPYIEDGLIVKLYPSCGYSTRAIDCASDIVSKSVVELDKIETIICYVSPLTDKVLRYRKPKNGTEAKFSLEYCIVQTLISGPLQLSHFEDEFVESQSMTRSLMDKVVRIIPDDMRQGTVFGKEYLEVEILLTTGKIIRARVSEPKGYPENPLTPEEFEQKFNQCTLRALTTNKQKIFFGQLMQLEVIEDFSHFINELICSIKIKV